MSDEQDPNVTTDAPRMKVVDRRWWARQEGDPAPVDEGRSSLKPTYVEQLEQQLAEKDRLVQGYAEKYKAASSEFEEARARMRREVMKDAERGRRAILESFLEVIDNLDRALAVPRDASRSDALLSGVEMVRRQFLAKLDAFGVTPIAALGARFDPARHEAVTTTDTTDPDQDGMVVGVVAQGYAIGDEVLRPSVVAVARANAGAPQD